MRPKVDFEPFRRLMEAAAQPEIAIRNFEHNYRLLCAGVAGVILESDIHPVGELPDAERLSAPPADVAAGLLAKTAIVKLNGGLGTTMGLDGPKSLLEVKPGYRFIDIIANQARLAGVPLVLMNSFWTERQSAEALEAHQLDNWGIPLSFLQHQVPKVFKETLEPAEFPEEPDLIWCPPGHGDLYPALITSGIQQRLLAAGIEYLFVSNADNLCATLDPSLLHYFADNDLDFMMEAAKRTDDDRKGGHLALRDGRLALREVAQCSDADGSSFQNIERHRYFNTNNLWINLPRLAELMKEREYILRLPLIRNQKTLDPTDKSTPAIYQLETAMGAAIEVFEKVSAVRVPRSRFSPVKSLSDLDRIRSDAYEVSENFLLIRR